MLRFVALRTSTLAQGWSLRGLAFTPFTLVIAGWRALASLPQTIAPCTLNGAVPLPGTQMELVLNKMVQLQQFVKGTNVICII
jgi:hypothetical protein